MWLIVPSAPHSGRRESEELQQRPPVRVDRQKTGDAYVIGCYYSPPPHPPLLLSRSTVRQPRGWRTSRLIRQRTVSFGGNFSQSLSFSSAHTSFPAEHSPLPPPTPLFPTSLTVRRDAISAPSNNATHLFPSSSSCCRRTRPLLIVWPLPPD